MATMDYGDVLNGELSIWKKMNLIVFCSSNLLMMSLHWR
jgi:hypothetical protein